MPYSRQPMPKPGLQGPELRSLPRNWVFQIGDGRFELCFLLLLLLFTPPSVPETTRHKFFETTGIHHGIPSVQPPSRISIALFVK